jgi:sugar lactone lactonase YvrE
VRRCVAARRGARSLDGVVTLPVRRPTACVFGEVGLDGLDGLDDLDGP